MRASDLHPLIFLAYSLGLLATGVIAGVLLTWEDRHRIVWPWPLIVAGFNAAVAYELVLRRLAGKGK